MEIIEAIMDKKPKETFHKLVYDFLNEENNDWVTGDLFKGLLFVFY